MNHLSDEERQHMEDELTKHYGERVAPVSAFCNAFSDWQTAIVNKVQRIDSGDEDDRWQDVENWRRLSESLAMLSLPIAKSNLLFRLIYMGLPLADEMCPEHQGHWSGCPWPGDECIHGCTVGGNTTGWIPKQPVPEGMRAGPVPVVVRDVVDSDVVEEDHGAQGD